MPVVSMSEKGFGRLEMHGKPVAFYSDKHSILRGPLQDPYGAAGGG